MMNHFKPNLKYDDPGARPSKWRPIIRQRELGYQMLPFSRVAELNCPRVGIIREPLERFRSLWRCQIRDGLPGISGRQNIKGPAELMDLIEESPGDNSHWMRQSLFCAEADLVIPLERLADWWGFQGIPAPLGRVNTTEGEVPIALELKERVLRHYRGDVRIYERAKDGFTI
jgi:hypothetical protein